MDAYDFIIIGAGASGCTVAWRLANTKTKPSILLVEAGGANADLASRADGDRWISMFDKSRNWGFKTTPQRHLDNRSVNYDRGRGMGGSTAINFCVYNTGPRDDWDEIARLTGDQDFAWKSVSEKFKRIETLHFSPSEMSADAASYLRPDCNDHGRSGPLQIGFAKNWEPVVKSMLDTCHDAGFPLNHDMNSGDPVGVGVTANTAAGGIRSTAADLVRYCPSNLTIRTDAQVNRLLFDGKKCVGVDIAGSKPIHANLEVIVSCGTLDSPKILLHSGIGPSDQLEKFGVKQLIDLPGVGQNLLDHLNIFMSWEKSPDSPNARRDFYRSKTEQEKARIRWTKDHTGPLADLCTTNVLGWLKSPTIESSPEFQALPQLQQDFLRKPTIPHYELALTPADAEYFIDPTNAPPQSTIGVFLLNAQSTGSVTLQSADPSIPLLFDPDFLSHPFDRRVAIEATRACLNIASHPSFAHDTICQRTGPLSSSEEDILAYWRATAMSTWHMVRTLRMGSAETMSLEKGGSCVDSSFRVLGSVEGLRVVDMSVCPVLPNAHTQGPAYVLGLVAGDKIVAEYALD